MTFKDLPAESYKLGVILRHGTMYELIKFLARLQVVAAHMAQEHAKDQMIQQALPNEVELDEELQLQKIGRKQQSKTCHKRIKLPELNTPWSKPSENWTRRPMQPRTWLFVASRRTNRQKRP